MTENKWQCLCFLLVFQFQDTERDLCIMWEDSVSDGKIGGQQPHLPRHMLLLQALQHQTQVRYFLTSTLRKTAKRSSSTCVVNWKGSLLCYWNSCFQCPINVNVPWSFKYHSNMKICCLKENSGTKWTFGLIKLWYLFDCSLRFVFMIIEWTEFYL